MRRSWMLFLAVFLAGAGQTALSRADVRLPAIIGNNMVLQADKPLPIWGWAEPGEDVTITLGAEKATAKADAQGNWRAALPAQKASATAAEMTVAGKNTIKITNILVGEVWGGSGQSNMQWSVNASANSGQEIQQANYPQIRLFLVPLRLSPTPLDNVDAKWVVCTPDTVPSFSAVLYFFGREIHKTLNVPVGLIGVSWGGSSIAPWMTYAQFAAQPELKPDLDNYNKMKADRTTAMAARKALLPALKTWLDTAEKAVTDGKDVPDAPVAIPADQPARKVLLPGLKAWLAAAEKAVAAGKDVPDAPAAIPADPLNQFTSPSAMYNGMVHALVPYAIRGFLWYQGESNRGLGMHYHELMKGLIANWRSLWSSGDFPFLWVQLAPYYYDANETALPEIWEAQAATLSVPNTGMAVTTDIATIKDIHPPNKQDVGKRLALWALANTYGKKDLVFSGPLYESMVVEGDKIRIKFKHTAPGLVARDGKPLSWFTIAGDDKQFYPAVAEIVGDTVVVSSPKVPKPTAVRFGWNQIAEPNLSNKAGLPASPFRTDHWIDAKNAPAQ